MSNVPPEMLGTAITYVNVKLTDKGWGGVGRSEIRGKVCCCTIVENVWGNVVYGDALSEWRWFTGRSWVAFMRLG